MGHLAWQCLDKDKETGLDILTVTKAATEPLMKAERMTKITNIAASKQLPFDKIVDFGKIIC
jgi:hypothetical protein